MHKHYEYICVLHFYEISPTFEGVSVETFSNLNFKALILLSVLFLILPSSSSSAGQVVFGQILDWRKGNCAVLEVDGRAFAGQEGGREVPSVRILTTIQISAQHTDQAVLHCHNVNQI
jgi:hypothetical protein